jgi:hypothetical protein
MRKMEKFLYMCTGHAQAYLPISLHFSSHVCLSTHLLEAELKVVENGSKLSLLDIEALRLESVGPRGASHLLEHASQGVHSLNTALKQQIQVRFMHVLSCHKASRTW